MGSKKQTTNTTAVTTKQNPQYMEDLQASLTNKIKGIGEMDPASFVAGADPLQTQAADIVKRLTSGGPDYGGVDAGYDEVADLLRGITGASTDYESQHTGAVVDTTLAGMDRQSARDKAALTLKQAGQNAFGGSGVAIEDALLTSEQGANRAAAEAQLRDEAWKTGQSLTQTALDRKLQATGMLGDLTTTRAGETRARTAEERANAAMGFDMGGMLRDIEQQRLAAPISHVDSLATLNAKMPWQLMTGETTNQNSTTKTKDPMGAIGGLAMLAAAPFTGGASLAGLGGMAGAAGGLGGLSAIFGGGAAAAGAGSLLKNISKVK
jgi:hypothetical protein